MNQIDRLLLLFIILMLVFNLIVIITLLFGQSQQISDINQILKEWEYASQ